MVKTNLPVIILRGGVLLPYCEFRLELNSDSDKEILNIAENNHDGNILIISPENPLEENIDFNELPKIGTVAKITMKMQIGRNTRIILNGINRVDVTEYNHEGDLIKATISPTTQFAMNPNDEQALIRKLTRKVEDYVAKVPNRSNSILAEITTSDSISKISDIVANYLPIDFDRRVLYLKTVNPYKRVIMLFEDIKTEEEILEIDKKIDIKLKQTLDDNQKEFILREKMRLIREELGDINAKDEDIEILKEKIENLECNEKVKIKLRNELKKYELMNTASPEVGIVRNYIDLMLNLPWNNESVVNSDLKLVKERLDSTHYGLDDVKKRIIEYLAVQTLNKDLNAPIICLVGPPGVGKTTFARSIANATDRVFTKISVGGLNDEAEIVGHRRTYIGANPGKIIAGMKKAGVKNPVFLIDEVDKMTKDLKGDPASALLEVLDKEQNMYFTDSYVEEEFDLSKVMFILTANYIYQIPEELKDRLEVIELSSYTELEKLDIAKRHLIKKLIDDHGLNDVNITFTDDAILKIIRNYTREAGVRDLERNISKVLRNIATDIVTNKKKKKYSITNKNISDYLGIEKYNESVIEINASGVVNGLAYTPYGGSALKIEVAFFPGKGNLILTGSLGDVMKESAKIALSYIKSNNKLFKIDEKKFENDIHIHVPEGATPKDGPSAGITLTTALVSAFTNKKINTKLAMTGEITLNGNILPIGGLKEKSIGAHKSGITTIIIPKDNEKDLEEVPEEIKKDIKYILVDNYKDAYKEILKLS